MIFTARVAKEAKDAKKTREIFFINVCFYYKVFKHSNTEIIYEIIKGLKDYTVR